jgi:hypothetical protein
MVVFAAGFLLVDSERRRILPARTLAILATLAGALILGAARGGAPTHHPERALLACFLIAPLFVASWAHPPFRRQVLGLATMGALLGAGLRVAEVAAPSAYVNRSREEAVGDFIERSLPKAVPVALALPDFGYFTVMAAAGKPQRFEILERHDPRERDGKLSLSTKLRTFVEGGGCYWVSESALDGPTGETLFSRADLEVRRAAVCPSP